MTENRRTLLASLKTVLEAVTGITTVVRHYAEVLDVSKYKEADMALIAIHEPSEVAEEELTSMRAMQWLEIKLRVYFMDWELVVGATYETLLKNIRDAIGADPRLNSSTVFTYVGSISAVEGEMPLYSFTVELKSRYYLDQTST